MSIKVLSIFGTRPEAVKMAPVVLRLVAEPEIISRVCVTAQHRQMLDQVLDLFHISPDYDLNIMQPGQELSNLTAEILVDLNPVFIDFNPDWIIIQGDTTTVMTAALLAYYHHVRVGHVEAGLRTHDKWQPFPEEINRRIAGVIADLHFAPTTLNRDNLLREGIQPSNIIITGNPVVDALQAMLFLEMPRAARQLLKDLWIGESGKRLVLITAHRRENFGQPLEEICQAVLLLSKSYGDSVQFLYPVHLNPNVQEPVYRSLSGIKNVTLVDPLDYLTLVHIMKKASLILTDSGGIQEEATAMGIPTLVLREVTERPEGVTAGILRLVGTDINLIVNEAHRILDNMEFPGNLPGFENPFGDGKAAAKIVKALVEFHKKDMDMS